MTPQLTAKTSSKTAAVRNFLRSLNILLKACRMYGMDHARTSAQLKSSWEELSAGLKAQGGLQIAVAGSRVMIDGEAIKATQAESSFAEMVSAAGISSIEFTPHATHDEFARFVRAFATSGPKFEGLSGLLKDVLGEGGANGIRVNEFRVVAADAVGESGQAQARVAGEAVARALGANAGELKDALADPQKLLALIAASEGASALQAGHRGGAAGGAGSASPGAKAGGTSAPSQAPIGQPAASTGDAGELAAFQMLSQLGRGTGSAGASLSPQNFQQQVAALPAQGRRVLQDVLGSLAAESPMGAQDPQLLLKLAERLAIRIAMQRFQRGDTAVDAVQQMLSRMGQEIDSLRKKLAMYEARAHAEEAHSTSTEEGLQRKFWDVLSDENKLRILMSPEAFNFPIRYIRQFIEHAPKHGDGQAPRTVLQHYTEGIRETNAETRLHVSEGITELGDLYAGAGDETLERAIAAVGAQLLVEENIDLQNALGSTLVQLSHFAADARHYGAFKQTLTQLNELAKRRPEIAKALRPRIGMENRAPRLIEEALKKPTVPPNLIALLREMPRAAALQSANQFNQATEKERSDRVLALAKALEPEIVQILRETLRGGPDSEALLTIGLLTRLDIGVMGEYLSARLPRWNHSYQNQVVRQIASSGATGRGELLARLMDRFDPLDFASAVDEIGMCGDANAAPRLQRIAGGEMPAGWPTYLRIKVIEALGRLRSKEAAPILRKIVEEKKLWIWAQPRELRVVALQALSKIEPDWAQKFLPGSGLSREELALGPREATADWAGVRQRCYERIRPPRALKAELSAQNQKFVVTIVDMSLGGAFAMGEVPLPSGTRAELTLKFGSVEVEAVVLLRGTRKGGVNFEIVDIEFEQRSKLRQLLIECQKQSG